MQNLKDKKSDGSAFPPLLDQGLSTSPSIIIFSDNLCQADFLIRNYSFSRPSSFLKYCKAEYLNLELSGITGFFL